MAINRGESIDEIRTTLGIAQPHEIYGGKSIVDSVEWPEHMIEAECTRLLEQDGWRSLRTDPVSDRGRGTGFGELGMADHWFGRPLPSAGKYACEMLWCEFKAQKRKAEKHQIEWHLKERAMGFQTWIANEDFPASVAGFVEHYRKSGLNRGRV